MLDFKKRLQSFMPGEATKAKLQDVLTVEWSGHKTVLVEVPTTNPKTDDVEMSGMSSPASAAGGGYGRLMDDDDDDDYRQRPLNRSTYSDRGPSEARERERQRSTSLQESQQPPNARPHNPNFTKYHSYSDNSRARNPFADAEQGELEDVRRDSRGAEGKFGEWAGPTSRSKPQVEDPFQ